MATWISRTLPIVSIVLAVLLLTVLLAVSTSSTGETFRAVDRKTQYSRELTIALDQRVTQALNSRGSSNADIAELAVRLPEVIDGIDADLRNIYQPESRLEQVRIFSAKLFNTIDVDEIDLSDPRRLRGSFALVNELAERVDDYLPVFIENSAAFATGTGAVARDSHLLVTALRTSGKDQLADQAFRAGEQTLEYLRAGDANRLAQIDAVLERLRLVMDSLGGQERDVGQALLTRVPELVGARRAMNDSVAAMDLASLAAVLADFRELATVDYVFALSMINDARVLLNLYTVLLLIVLAYFGMRLRSSYVALNRSHGQLESRVQERTADLEEAYDNLQESQVQLVQAEKMSSLGQLVAGVMHEINTPLLYVLNNTSMTAEVVTEMRGYVAATLPLLQARCSQDLAAAVKDLVAQRDRFEPAAIQEGIGEIASLSTDSIDGLNQISDLVQSLKDFSRLDRAGEDRFNVCEGIEKTLTITRNLLKYGIEVEKRLAHVDDIFCSPAQINQIFVNLVTNAIQAMDGNGTLTIETSQTEELVMVSFTDTGCGISEENLNKIMDPFFTTKPVGQGTGLGLSIVRQIVDQHSGDVVIESEQGRGTCVTISLPKHRIADEEAA